MFYPSPGPSLERKTEMLGTLREKRTGQTLGSGPPNGKVDGEPNSLYLDTANATLWIKEYDGKKTGWITIGRLTPDGAGCQSSPAAGRL
jgi:hypothetical protein